MASGNATIARELRGLALPATRGPGGFFASRTAYDVAWGDLLLALLTPRGSRPMRRAFGCTLYELLFDPATIEFEIAEVVIRDAAEQFCPHLVIREVTMITRQRTVELGVVFSLRTDTSQTESRTVTIEKSFLSVETN